MLLEGSCHCGAVRFSVESLTPYPYNHCYCSKCRKTGGAGYSVNIMGNAESLRVEGEENLSVYRSRHNDRGVYDEDGLGYSGLHFCKRCSTALWIHGNEYPQWIYPRASAIDTALPLPPSRTHLMLGSKPDWVPCHAGASDKKFDGYPDEGIADWHRRNGLSEV